MGWASLRSDAASDYNNYSTWRAPQRPTLIYSQFNRLWHLVGLQVLTPLLWYGPSQEASGDWNHIGSAWWGSLGHLLTFKMSTGSYILACYDWLGGWKIRPQVMKRTLASDYDFMSENITINLAIERLLKGGGIRYVCVELAKQICWSDASD